MTILDEHDLYWCVRRLPQTVREMMKRHGVKMILGGGFIRSMIAGEKAADLDFFSSSKDYGQALAKELAGDGKVYETDNAFTVCGRGLPVQFIHRWTYEHPADVVESFDFTIAQSVVWFDGKAWCSQCSDRFYRDLAAKRLVYTSPKRNEDAGGSMLRVLKFYQKGYRIPLDSLGAVVARLMKPVNPGEIESVTADRWGSETVECQLAKVVTGLLHEVDPNIDPEHIYHLPSMTAKDEANGE